jgi:hypothetical protein
MPMEEERSHQDLTEEVTPFRFGPAAPRGESGEPAAVEPSSTQRPDEASGPSAAAATRRHPPDPAPQGGTTDVGPGAIPPPVSDPGMTLVSGGSGISRLFRRVGSFLTKSLRIFGDSRGGEKEARDS